MAAAVRLSSQRITHVIHIADIHVRCGNNEVARIDEYDAVFTNFLADIGKLPAVVNGTALCVIAGDVFETKTRAETAGGIMLFSFINKLQELVPIVIICGNHDFKQSEPDTPDSVDMVTMPYKSAKEIRVHYLKDTDHYIWGNIGFGLCSVKDTLRAHNTAGVVENLPEFPSPDDFPDEVEYKIALFHGTISQSALPTGRSSETMTHGYPLEWFAGYDAVMLGDNHQQQLHTTSTGMHWGYPGSLVQQNFGEPLYGHGYILWDIANNKGSLHHVYNDQGGVTIVDDMIMLSPISKVSFKDATELPYFPKHPRVRIVGDQEDATFVQTYFLKYGVVPSYVTLKGKHVYSGGGGGGGSGGDDDDTLGEQMNTLSDLNSPQYWEAFMNDQQDSISVSEWIYTPASMLLPLTYKVPEAIADAMVVRNNKLQQLLQTYEKCANSPSVGTHRIILKYMEWDNLMSFGGDNRFDFETIDNKIALLNGANATGKSSFLDVLCIAIYGEPTASRRDFSGTNISHKIMNDHKPPNASCGVVLVVSIDDTLYEIYRSFTSHSQDKDTIKAQIVAIYKYVDTPGEEYKSKEIIAEGNSMVNAWIARYFGTSEEILMSTILCQSDTTNFFFKTHTEQRHILDKALHLDTISTYVDVLDESIKAHKYMVDKVASYRAGMTDGMDPADDVSVEDLNRLQAAADTAKTQARNLQAVKDELLSSIGDIKEIKRISREHDETIHDIMKEKEAALENMGGVGDGDDTRDLYIRLQVEHEEMIKTALQLKIPAAEYTLMNKRSLSAAKKELAAHLNKKPGSNSRYSREHILSKMEEYSEWLKNVPCASVDINDARCSLALYIAEYDEITEKYYKIKGYNLVEPSSRVDIRDEGISVDDAIQQYYNLGIGVMPDHSSDHYENVITTYDAWKATCPAEWLHDADAKLVELRKRESDLNLSIDEYYTTSFYINKPSMKRPIELTGAASGGKTWTKAALDQLQVAIVPCRPVSGLPKWKKTLAEWKAFAHTVPSETLAEVERSLECVKLKDEIAELAKIECNPECHVCCKNPGVVRKKALEKKLGKLGDGTTVERDRKTLERLIPVRRSYDERVEWMTAEIAAWESAQADFERERQRAAELAVAWWTLWGEWENTMSSMKQERGRIRTEIESIVEHTRIYTQKHAEYIDATSKLEQARAHDERMVAWNVAWHAVQRDIGKYKDELKAMATKIEYLKQHISWDEELTVLKKEEALLEAMDTWTARHDLLEHEVAVEKWKQRWAVLSVEYAAHEVREQLQSTVHLYKRIIAYWQFEDLDEQLTVASAVAEASTKTLDAAKENARRSMVRSESARDVDNALQDLRTRLEKLNEFQRRFVGDKQNDGFKMWVYRSKVLPLIEQEVNRFIGYIDTFTLSVRIRKGNFIYMLHDRGSNPTLDHASGYQKFIVGLAMRVALARIGAVGQNVKHMFIDEGFVACDATNMMKTKEIMDLMLRLGGYQSILLITHLDTIKEIAQTRIDVCRIDGDLTSYIRLGLKRKVVPKIKKADTAPAVKKRGRQPKKAAVPV